MCDFNANINDKNILNDTNSHSYDSFGEYLAALPHDTIFRLWEYKRMFTPYEQEEKFSDESEYKSIECIFVRIKDVITLPDGDLLLATARVGLDDYTEYYKLSNISLAKSDKDMEEEE